MDGRKGGRVAGRVSRHAGRCMYEEGKAPAGAPSWHSPSEPSQASLRWPSHHPHINLLCPEGVPRKGSTSPKGADSGQHLVTTHHLGQHILTEVGSG